jgi:hypothetical protein
MKRKKNTKYNTINRFHDDQLIAKALKADKAPNPPHYYKWAKTVTYADIIEFYKRRAGHWPFRPSSSDRDLFFINLALSSLYVNQMLKEIAIQKV